VAFEIVCGGAAPISGAGISKVALFPGAWDPPTVAHLAIAHAARRQSGHVVWVLPRAFPHKTWNQVGITNRIAMLCAIARSEPGFSVATTGGGLYREIANEARQHFGPTCEISLACGRDAAERIASWDYGVAGAFEDLLANYPILAASRAGDYTADPRHSGRIVSLPLETQFEHVSSSEVRRRIASGEVWEELVPEAIVNMVRDLYS